MQFSKFLTISAMCLGLTAVAAEAKQTKAHPIPADYLAGKQMLDKEALRKYVADRDDIKPDDKDYQAKTDLAIGALLAKAHAARPPLSADSVATIDGVVTATPWKQASVPGLFNSPKAMGADSSNPIVGPLVLRKTVDGWKDSDEDAKGAMLSYANDRLKSQTKWTTEGALIYPVRIDRNEPSNDQDRWRTNSHIWRDSLTVLPAASWHYVDVSSNQKDNINELTFQVPLSYNQKLRGTELLRQLSVDISPYYLTDFNLKGGLVGVSATATPVMLSPEAAFAVNTGFKGLFASGPISYRLILVPEIDFNHLASSSQYIVRTDHPDYFRSGGKVGLDLSLDRVFPVQASISYHALAGLKGAPSYTDLISASMKIGIGHNIAVTAEYQKGSTPVAAKDIDLVTIGLEVKFGSPKNN